MSRPSDGCKGPKPGDRDLKRARPGEKGKQITTAALHLLLLTVVQPQTTTPATGATRESAPPVSLVRLTERPLADQPRAPARTGGTEAEIVVTGRSRRGDPAEPVNAATFAATQAVDDAVVGPAARAYRKAVPSPIRDGLRNFLLNFREPVVFVNYLLQFKPGKAGETLGRFAINSTVGAAGLFDVARRKPFRLPRRRNSFANTLGYYGVKPGPFFFLPLIGPTTLRDLAGDIVDQVAVPIGPIRPLRGSEFTIPIGVMSALDYRAEFDDELTKLRASPDPYAARRKFYLDRRQAEIDALRGRNSPPPPIYGTPIEPASPADIARQPLAPELAGLETPADGSRPGF